MSKTAVALIIGLLCLTGGCAQGTGGEGGVDASAHEDAGMQKELSFEEYVRLLKGLKPVMPVEGSHFTAFEGQLPNAPRAYRHGYHEGFDFYDGFCGVKIEQGTPVVSVARGRVVRLDTSYVEIAPDAREKLLEQAKELGATPDSTQDILRGRQVWIDHGNGIVTRYCHLSGVVEDIPEEVAAGTVIGFIGGSGTKSKTPHLHFEIRLGEHFFGKDMSPEAIKKVAAEIFSRAEGSP